MSKIYLNITPEPRCGEFSHTGRRDEANSIDNVCRWIKILTMNMLKSIVWIVVIAVVVWVGYIFIYKYKKLAVPAAQQGAPVAETVGQSVVPAPSPSGALPPAPAPTITPAPAPAPSVTPPVAPAPVPQINY